MKRADLIVCLYNSAAMLMLADSELPPGKEEAKWRAECRRLNAGQAGLLREAAHLLDTEGLED